MRKHFLSSTNLIRPKLKLLKTKIVLHLLYNYVIPVLSDFKILFFSCLGAYALFITLLAYIYVILLHW